jgi:hypothetical protein
MIRSSQTSRVVNVGLVFLLIVMSLFLVSCQEASGGEEAGGAEIFDPDAGEAQPLPEQEEAAPAEVEEGSAGEALVDSIEVQLQDAATPQVLVTGNLPDGCTQLTGNQVERQGNTFEIILVTDRLADQMCTEALVPFQETIPLEVMNLPAGEYTVNVNGETETFTLEADSANQEVPFNSPEEAEAYYVNEAKESLAQQRSVELDEIQVESFSPVEGQEEVYSIKLRLEDQTYEYQGQAGRVLPFSEPVAETGELPGEGLSPYTQIVEALDATGATVQAVGETSEPSQPFFSVPSQVVMVNGEEVQVYIYEDETAAEAEAAQISPDGTEMTPTEGSEAATVDWVDTPHFYRKGPALVLYVGNATDTLEALEIALGPQFAGGEVPQAEGSDG